MNKLMRLVSLLALLGTPGCESETVVQVDFEADTLGAIPGPVQDVGTVSVVEGSDSRVRVVPSPEPAVDGDKWVRITRPARLSDIPSLRARFARSHQDGNYLSVVRLFVPAGAGAVTVQFEPENGPDLFAFFHVDLLPTGQVRINDDPGLVFGSFPHGQVFSLAVNFNISATSATATVTLLGAASGSMDVPIPASLHSFARQYGAVRLWMGFPHTGSFFADDLSVLRSPP